MNTVIKGAKAGQGKARQPYIAPDSAQSKTFIKILYGVSEGEIEGLADGFKSVYLDDTPIQDASGNNNFNGVQVDFRNGTNDQEYIEGFPDVSSETAINVELKSSTPFVRAISNTQIDALRIRFKWAPLRNQNAENGDVSGVTIQYAIDVQTDGGTWTEFLNTQISDKTSANYLRSHRIDLPKANSGWQIRVRRLTPNSTSEYISDKMYIDAITEVIDLKLNYPNTALLGLQYDAEIFSNVAKMAVDLKGLKLQVPSNYDPIARTYTGMWNGTFKRAYTNNPAWIYYDLCTNKRAALGDRLTSAMIDKWSLYRLAQYCDQLVDDGKGGKEPRFTCNVYLQTQEDAYSILSKLAGVFRAISYWDGNSIVCDADIPQDTYFTYTRANVIDGHFEYSGTRARDRHTVAKVAWDNPENRYKTEYAMVRDEVAIAKLGVRTIEIDAWGCTSEGQAQRAGLWALKSEQLETRSVSFKVGLDGYIPQPGKIVEIADELFAGRANGGRISAVAANLKSITFDRDDVMCRAGDRLVVNGEDGKAQARIVSSKSGRIVTVTVPFDSVAAQNVWVVDSQDLKTMKFRVMSIAQDEKHQFSINALQYEQSKFDAIDFGAFVDERPISIINPTIQAPVASVLITSENMVQQGLSVATMIVAWPQIEGAVKYQAEWRKDDGSWIKLPIAGNNSIEVQGIYAGNYQARVAAINAFDVASLPTYSVLTTLSGKEGLPPKLAFIQATGKLFGFELKWGFPAVGALDTAYTEIRIASTANGANAAQLGLFAYPTTTHTINGAQPNLTQWFSGRLIDRIGNIGEWSEWTSATSSADASAVLNILSGKISSSQLSTALNTEIGKINSFDQRVIDAEQKVIEVDGKVSGVVESQENIIDEQIVLSEKINGVYARTNPLTADGFWTADSTSTEATAWSLYSASIIGDMAQAERIDQVAATMAGNDAIYRSEIKANADATSALVSKTDTLQTSLNGNTASIQETAESVDGLYAQKFTKIDVNGKVAGWGGANDGVESSFIFNVDSLAIGSGDSAGYYPFIFRNTPFTDPLTGMVFPISAYMKSAMMDYQSVKTSHIEDLAVKTAKIDNLAVKSGNIDNLAVTTLKIMDEAVTVPAGITNSTGLSVTSMINPAIFGNWVSVLRATAAQIGNVASITINRNGGKCRIDASVLISDIAATTTRSGGFITGVANQLMTGLVLYRNGVAIADFLVGSPAIFVGEVAKFNIAMQLPVFIDDAATGTNTYSIQVGVTTKVANAGVAIYGTDSGYASKIVSASIATLELKK